MTNDREKAMLDAMRTDAEALLTECEVRLSVARHQLQEIILRQRKEVECQTGKL